MISAIIKSIKTAIEYSYSETNNVTNGNFDLTGDELVTNGNFSATGSDLIDNGDFSATFPDVITDANFPTPNVNWTLGNGWSIGTGIYDGTAISVGTNAAISQANILELPVIHKTIYPTKQCKK